MPFGLDLLTTAFAGVCDRAARLGLRVHLEPMPWTAVPTVEVARRIVVDAGCGNGGIMLDAWHFARAVTPLAALDAAAPHVIAVQLGDAPARAEANLIDETLHRRRLPGEGDLDLAALVRRLDAGGCEAPIGIEVFSDELLQLPPREVARRAGDALHAVLARARRQPISQ
jgi:sugar phosphate isomerase/epimerase